MTDVDWINWWAGTAFVIEAKADCECPTDTPPLGLENPSNGSVRALSGTLLQFIGLDGTELFPPEAQPAVCSDCGAQQGGTA
jgi:hypothetical protein